MKVLSVRTLKDGSGSLRVEFTEEEHNIFMRVGLQRVADEEAPGKIKVLGPECAKFFEKAKRMEIDDETSNWLVGVGVTQAIEEHIERLKAEEGV